MQEVSFYGLYWLYFIQVYNKVVIFVFLVDLVVVKGCFVVEFIGQGFGGIFQVFGRGWCFLDNFCICCKVVFWFLQVVFLVKLVVVIWGVIVFV